MKTNKLPKSAWSDAQEAGSQSMQTSQSSVYYPKDNKPQTGNASNDASYSYESSNDAYSDYSEDKMAVQEPIFGYRSAVKNSVQTKESAMSKNGDVGNENANAIDHSINDYKSGYKKPQNINKKEPLMAEFLDSQSEVSSEGFRKQDAKNLTLKKSYSEQDINALHNEIPERVFMNGLIKHTGIALAIIIPLAAFSAYAATPTMASATATNDAVNQKTTAETLIVEPNNIIHKSASTPTTVDSVDLKKYAGTWYEIGRLPMYFQRNCASDVTATYTEKTDGSGIVVTNKCADADGSSIVADGLAKPVDNTGSKLKVTFLPSWIRWLPVGRADYWVLARDADYKTALVGTPDKDYLWLLARSPNISQETYAKYRQIAQQQGYNLKEFKLTPHTSQTVSLVP